MKIENLNKVIPLIKQLDELSKKINQINQGTHFSIGHVHMSTEEFDINNLKDIILAKLNKDRDIIIKEIESL